MASGPVPPSTLSLPVLLRHLGEVERDWRNWITAGEPAGRIYGPAGSDFEAVRPDPAQASQALRILHEKQDATDRLLAGFEDLGQRAGREQVVIRDLMVHRIEEYARHSGHADLLRECIDGRVGQWRSTPPTARATLRMCRSQHLPRLRQGRCTGSA